MPAMLETYIVIAGKMHLYRKSYMKIQDVMLELPQFHVNQAAVPGHDRKYCSQTGDIQLALWFNEVVTVLHTATSPEVEVQLEEKGQQWK